MNEPLIRDSAFKGSPIMSYGQFGARNKWLKLLAIVAGSFGALILGVGIWFWFFSSLPLPTASALMAIIPPGHPLPSGVPGVWREAVEHNYPLPTVVGLWSSDQPEDKLVPFAVQVFDFANNQANGWKMWRILAQDTAPAVESKAPFQVFGNPWSDQGSLIWLSISPAQVLRMDREADLPPVLQGYVHSQTWKVQASSEQFAGQEPDWSTNYLSLSSVKSNYLANFTAYYGEQMHNPLDWVHWEHGDDLTLFFKPSEGSEAGYASQTLTVGNLLLPDDYVVEVRQLTDTVVYSTHTQIQTVELNIPYGSGVYLDPTTTQTACQGQRLVAFDEQSIKNICSWSDICYVKLKSLVINKQEQYINFCFN